MVLRCPHPPARLPGLIPSLCARTRAHVYTHTRALTGRQTRTHSDVNCFEAHCWRFEDICYHLGGPHTRSHWTPMSGRVYGGWALGETRGRFITYRMRERSDRGVRYLFHHSTRRFDTRKAKDRRRKVAIYMRQRMLAVPAEPPSRYPPVSRLHPVSQGGARTMGAYFISSNTTAAKVFDRFRKLFLPSLKSCLTRIVVHARIAWKLRQRQNYESGPHHCLSDDSPMTATSRPLVNANFEIPRGLWQWPSSSFYRVYGDLGRSTC